MNLSSFNVKVILSQWSTMKLNNLAWWHFDVFVSIIRIFCGINLVCIYMLIFNIIEFRISKSNQTLIHLSIIDFRLFFYFHDKITSNTNSSDNQLINTDQIHVFILTYLAWCIECWKKELFVPFCSLDLFCTVCSFLVNTEHVRFTYNSFFFVRTNK